MTMSHNDNVIMTFITYGIDNDIQMLHNYINVIDMINNDIVLSIA